MSQGFSVSFTFQGNSAFKNWKVQVHVKKKKILYLKCKIYTFCVYIKYHKCTDTCFIVQMLQVLIIYFITIT